jgi:hypothetical protein
MLKLATLASLSNPSPAERVGRVALAKRRSGGGVGFVKQCPIFAVRLENPHPGSLLLADPPRKGEG